MNCIYVIALPVCYEYFLLLLTYMYMIIYSIPYEHLRTALKMYAVKNFMLVFRHVCITLYPIL